MSNPEKQSDFYKNKRVLVAGASGFVGTHLTRNLVEAGAKVRGTIYRKPIQREEPEAEFMKADLTRPEDCAAVCKNIDYVFMAAANSSGAAVIDKTPLVHLTPNIVMNAYMLEGAYAAGVKKFCFISSNTVYPLTDFAVKEDDVNYEFFDKYFVVGWMKRFTELMCQMYSEKIKSPMQTLVVRPGNLYGPYDKYTWKESKVIAALIRRAVERHDPFTVWGDGLDIKDFLYIKDFVAGLTLAFEKIDGFDSINIASGTPVSIREVLAEILEASNYESAVLKYDSSQPTMIPKRSINTEKMNSLTGWMPQKTLKEGIKETVAWYKKSYADFPPEDLTN